MKNLKNSFYIKVKYGPILVGTITIVLADDFSYPCLKSVLYSSEGLIK
jgi:hypothetical protein